MYQLIITIHILVCLAIIGLVLLQHGKGADMGASLGSSASNTLFGSQGSGNFLFKATGFLAALFFASCLLLSGIAVQKYKQSSTIKVQKSISKPAKSSEPAEASEPAKTV